MKILYCAIDQRVPGTTGGSVHVRAVADGLAARGHEVHVLATPGRPGGFPAGPVRWHALAPPLGQKRLRFARARQVWARAREVQPDVIIERYFNFGGEGIRTAARMGALAVLEVNAPVVDHPGSWKRRLDLALLVEPMRRWRDWQCRHADLLVTPTAAILPRWIDRNRVLEIEWGADTTRFHPGARGDVPFTRQPGALVAVFAGAFRRWHGARLLLDAVRRLEAGSRTRVQAVFIGDGPERRAVEQAAVGLAHVTFTGPVPHDAMPAALAACDVGVAPFEVAAHPPLRLDFFWSPLKIFEYMASGLPVVAPDIDRLRRIVRDGQEGILYDPADAGALARAIESLADPARREVMGQAARARVVAEFSWARHAERLEEAFLARLRSRGR